MATKCSTILDVNILTMHRYSGREETTEKFTFYNILGTIYWVKGCELHEVTYFKVSVQTNLTYRSGTIVTI